ncbi:MAG: hypothetical protein HRT47_10850 [Candidatus Caenarcaniphilales bacterium]|nr:hypothetical protein [Candidatus Caenarcaniphilales bacterium]
MKHCFNLNKDADEQLYFLVDHYNLSKSALIRFVIKQHYKSLETIQK